ncbi:MAG: SdiA-regulated domain-containing protein [Bacteroidetes bacterium]|nr:SdiA-regulated domain-containing protein [Bacteroidota bacterium]
MAFSFTTRYGYAALLLLSVCGACNMLAQERKIKGYDLGKPEKFHMPQSLIEISGIAFYHGQPDTIFAIQDEQGRFYRLRLGVKKQSHTKFGKSGDYEDVSLMDDQVIVLKSNGTLYTFPLSDTSAEEAAHVQEWKDLLPPGEYESLYADARDSAVYLLCKNCPQADSKVSVPGYRIPFDGHTFGKTETFSIDVNQIKAIDGKVKRGFRPSGMAKNPVTGEWFILSAVNQLLVITDRQWKVTNVYHLDGNRFTQPEGIAFDNNGNLYISNEGDHINDGNILKFNRQKN